MVRCGLTTLLWGRPGFKNSSFVMNMSWAWTSIQGCRSVFTQSGTDYVGCAGSNECLSQALPWRTAWAPTQFPIPSGTIGEPASQTPLTDGGSPLLNDFSDQPVLMVARGPCTFLQKWQSAEQGGWGGILVVD